jgi:hypothetical protein
MNWYDVFKLLNLLYYQILFYILVKLVFLLHIHRKLLLTSHGEACLLFNSIDQSFDGQNYGVLIFMVFILNASLQAQVYIYFKTDIRRKCQLYFIFRSMPNILEMLKWSSY